jgi:hypothetical protein
MTSDQSSQLELERQIDVSLGAIKRSLEWAYQQYNECEKAGYSSSASYWNGYIRAMQHVLEMENQ